MAEKRFPPGFRWGAATASYQVEGGIESNDWAQAARESKVPPCGRACEHYNRFEEDFDIAKSLGHNCHRLSIEWARIEPEEGRFDEREIEHYRKVLQALHTRGLLPFVTIWHFTLPLWFSQAGGFEREDAPEIFARYSAYVAGKLDLCAHFSTINEPMVYAGKGFWEGLWPPFCKNPLRHIRVVSRLAAAHCAAYMAMKKVRPEIQVGVTKHNIFFESNANPFNIVLYVFIDWFWNHRFLHLIAGHQDFIELNHYHHKKFGATKRERDSVVRSDMGWEVHPTSLYYCLLALKRYDLPIYVSEHGLADAADSRRTEFIKNAARSVHRALAEGIPVKGYCYWSLLDNYEWASGFTPRFGLVDVDYATQERRIRESAYVYKQICVGNALIDPAVNVGDSLSREFTKNSDV